MRTLQKWGVGMVGSGLVGIDESLRELALVLGLVVSLLTIINLGVDLYRKYKGKK